jgi:2-dehydro-3-deoxygluconokinase
VTAGALGAIGEGLVELGCDGRDARGEFRCGFGGDAANTAVMAARAGTDARLCGRVGGDALGRRLLAFWSEVGVDLSAVRIDGAAPTGIYVNERDADGAHRFDYHRTGSAGSRLTASDVTDDFLEGLAYLHYTGVTMALGAGAAEASAHGARAAKPRGVRISFAVNHRPLLRPRPSLLAAAAHGADVVFASAEDALAVFGTGDESALAGLIGEGRELVVTAGEAGATVHWLGRTHRVAAPAVQVVDAAGAGDALAGAYLAARIDGAEPDEALRSGVAAASLSCTAAGCAISYPDSAAVEDVAVALA